MTTYLDLEDLIYIAERVLAPTRPAIRDMGGLQSAATRPQTTVFGADAYPTLPTKAAALMESLARNHPLIDGNKRLTWAGTVAFLILNGLNLRSPTVDDGERFVLAVAQGQLDLESIAATIASWCGPTS